MRFADPDLLWMLGALPVLVVGLALRFGWRRHALARLGDAALLASRISPLSHGRRLFKTGALVVALAGLALGRRGRPRSPGLRGGSERCQPRRILGSIRA